MAKELYLHTNPLILGKVIEALIADCEATYKDESQITDIEIRIAGNLIEINYTDRRSYENNLRAIYDPETGETFSLKDMPLSNLVKVLNHYHWSRRQIASFCECTTYQVDKILKSK